MSIAKISSDNFRKIREKFDGEIEKISLNDILKTNMLTKAKQEELANAGTELKDFLIELEKLNIEYLTYDMEKYPKKLKNIPDPPYVLYYMGNLSLLSTFMIGIIGSRKPSAYGLYAAEFFAEELAKIHITTVSGLAMGIDGVSQKKGIASGGRCVAVLGSPLNNIYPKSNKKLFEEMIKNHLVITEINHRQSILPYWFSMRNRIIAALSDGLLVIEAGYKSGTLITVNYALQYGVNVFAVPGNINSSNSKGTNSLIKSGAQLTTDINDILEQYPTLKCENLPEIKKHETFSDSEIKVMELLKKESPLYVDLISEKSGMDIKQVSGILSILEIKDKILEIGNGLYSYK